MSEEEEVYQDKDGRKDECKERKVKSPDAYPFTDECR
jgi:hypothetical protein